MASVIYDGIIGVPLEYCRYYPKYDKCLEWMKENHPDVFAEEIKDIQERDPKTAKKCQHLWDDGTAQNEEKDNNDNDEDDNQQQQKGKKKKGNNNNNNNDEDDNEQQQKGKKKRGRRGKRGKGKGNNNNQNDDFDNKQTKQVQIMESQVNQQQNIAQQNMDDIQGMLDKLSTSPSKGILKNKNPNYEQEQQNLNDSQMNSGGDDSDDLDGPNFLGMGGNANKARGPPARKDTKKKKRKKKHNRDRRRPKSKQDEEDEDDENKENEEEEEETFEQRQKRVKFEKMKNKKVPKNIVEVTLENRKGNKRVTIVRGFIEKSKDKEQRIKSEFMKKFATSCMITFQNQGSDKGPKQVVLMGDKRYDFMKYLKDKFPKAGKLLYYKTKKYGLTPAVDPDHGFVMPPP